MDSQNLISLYNSVLLDRALCGRYICTYIIHIHTINDC